VFVDNPVKALIKVPVPVPSVVIESAIVGFAEVLQQTPLAVIAAKPSFVIFPPLVAVVVVMEDVTVVVRVGSRIGIIQKWRVIILWIWQTLSATTRLPTRLF
jgi:hypothetical protein